MMWVAVTAPALLIALSALVSASQHWEQHREVQAIAAAAARAAVSPYPLSLRSVDHDRRQAGSNGAAMVVPVDRDRAAGRDRAVVSAEPGATLAEIVFATVPVDVHLAGPVDLPIGASADFRIAVTVEVVAPVDYVFPAFGLAHSVSGRATAVAVEAGPDSR
ncbi:MAG: hypothetical protein ACR2QK_12885 [Acidimicrobiales bacterium]